MKFNRFLLAFTSSFFLLLASFAHAQEDGVTTISLDQRESGPPAQTTITTGVSPTGAGTATGGGTKAAGAKFALTATPNASLKTAFLNWTVNSVVVSTNSHYTFTTATSAAVVANFGYAITATSSPAAGGKISGTGAYPAGQSVTVTATPNGCYDFVKWTIGARTSTENPYTFTPSAGEALVADFQLIEDAITTSSSPPNGGKTSGGGNKGCGAEVKLTATPAAGYKFNGWMANGIMVSLANPYSFQAEGAEAVTATFADISVPTLAFVSPKVSESVAGSFLTITGTANNALGVSSVVLTVGGVPATVTTGNNWSNWTASVTLSSGPNVIDAHALSEAGNPSKTETITVTDTSTGLAPASLAGLITQVTQNGNAPFPVSFGTSTFEQFGGSANQSSAVGNYTYTQTGPNTATLVFNVFAPPNQTGQGSSIVSLTFTSPTAASFTDNFGDTGTITLSPGSAEDFSSVSGWTFVLGSPSAGPVDTASFGDGVFTNIDTNGTSTTGQYTSMQYGPMATMVVTTNVDPYVGGTATTYLMFLFSAAGDGNFFTTYYDGAGDAPTYAFGTFTGAYQPNGVNYIAPATFNGHSSTVTQKSPSGQSPFNVAFGQATMSQTTSSTDNSSRVSNYVYTRTGRTTGVLNILDYLPPSNGNSDNGGLIYLTFTSPTSATFNKPDGPSSGTITSTVLPAANYFAPAALPHGTLVFHSIVANHGGTATLNDGNFTIKNASGGGTSSGTYTYSQYSPTVGMLILTHTDPSDAGVVSDLQMTFNSASGGSVVGDAYDTNIGGSVATGTFTLTQ